jgi:CubicO group peptidase (beta-lactamase class C family)
MLVEGHTTRLVCALAFLTLVAAACTPLASHSPTVAPTAASSTPSDEALSAELEAYMGQQAANLSFSGAALVARRGHILLQRGYGSADRRRKLPNTERTQFRIASITKQFTAVAILLLHSRGKLDVREHLCDYISDCPAAWAEITLHQLLTHTSGIHNLYADPDYTAWQATPAAPAEVMQHYIDLPLDFAPGTSWSYTNSGYDLLGQVIERASGLTYEGFLRENIFQPLAMRDTGLLGATRQAAGYGNSYELAPAETSHPVVDYAAGGLYSTVGDLYLWDQALFNDQFLSPQLRAMAFTPYEPVPGFSGVHITSYGYGFMLGQLREPYDQHFIAHGGRLDGYSAMNAYFPDEQVAVVLLGNQRDPPVTGIFTQLATMVFEPR